MFTGIIEAVGKVIDIKKDGDNYHFKIETGIASELKIDQSIAHNGVCLTVTDKSDIHYWVTAIYETLQKSNLGNWQKDTLVNLERSMTPNQLLDGHIVQGHVDTIATCTSVKSYEGSWQFRFEFDPQFAHLIVEKGSVAINGVSLTCFNAHSDNFEVAIIPYTYEHTNFKQIKEGTQVNIEFDILGKYAAKWMSVFGKS